MSQRPSRAYGIRHTHADLISTLLKRVTNQIHQPLLTFKDRRQARYVEQQTGRPCVCCESIRGRIILHANDGTKLFAPNGQLRKRLVIEFGFVLQEHTSRSTRGRTTAMFLQRSDFGQRHPRTHTNCVSTRTTLHDQSPASSIPCVQNERLRFKLRLGDDEPLDGPPWEPYA